MLMMQQSKMFKEQVSKNAVVFEGMHVMNKSDSPEASSVNTPVERKKDSLKKTDSATPSVK